jgi:hypothetical protein
MKIKEILQAPEEKFKSHIALQYNSRIIFSGQYGSCLIPYGDPLIYNIEK